MKYVIKKRKINFYDGDYYSWRVINASGEYGRHLLAEFFGIGARKFASKHAKRLNALPKKDQP